MTCPDWRPVIPDTHKTKQACRYRHHFCRDTKRKRVLAPEDVAYQIRCPKAVWILCLRSAAGNHQFRVLKRLLPSPQPTGSGDQAQHPSAWFSKRKGPLRPSRSMISGPGLKKTIHMTSKVSQQYLSLFFSNLGRHKANMAWPTVTVGLSFTLRPGVRSRKGQQKRTSTSLTALTKHNKIVFATDSYKWHRKQSWLHF